MARFPVNSRPRTATTEHELESAISAGTAGVDAPIGELQQNGGSALLDLLTEDELAAAMKRTPGTLRRWRHAGTGPPYIPVGKAICYRPDAVRTWLVSLERSSGSPINTRRRRHARARK